MIKKVFINTGAQIIGKVTTATTTLFLTVIIGRALGPAGYGDFVKIFTFIGYFYIFTDFGLNSAFIKIAQTKKDDSYIKFLLGLRIILALFLVFIALVISIILPYDNLQGTGFSPIVKIGVAIASITILTQATITSVNAIFQKNLRYELTAVAAIAGTITTGIATITIFLIRPSLNMFTVAYVAGALATTVLALLLAQKNFKQDLIPKFNIDKFKKMIIYAWPIGIALILNMIYFRMDVFILAYTRPPDEVGIYGLAYQFFEASLAIPIFFANALFPLLMGIHASDKKEYVTQTKKWFSILLGVSLLITVGLIFASFLIPLLFDKFHGSQQALMTLSLGMPFFFISALYWHRAIIESRQKALIPVYFAGGTINICLNLLLIPIYGFIAAAWVTVFSEALIVLFLILALRNNTVSKQKQLAN